jgi:hypothetical protein
MLNYDNYIFEQKLNSIFSNINEEMTWLSDTEVEWEVIEEVVPKTNPKFWNIIDLLPNKFKNLLGKLLNYAVELLNNVTIEHINKLLNKIVEKITFLVKNVNIRRKLIYLSVFFIISATSISMMDITSANPDVKSSLEQISIVDNPQSSAMSDVVTTQKNSKPEVSKPEVKMKSRLEFLNKLAFKESSGIWDTVRYVNRKRDKKRVPVYVGKYQFGNMAFKDIKSKVRVHNFAKDPSIWTEEQQDKDIMQLIKNNKHYLRKKSTFKGYQHYLGKTINGVEITESGVMAAAHLIGNSGVKKFLRSNGEKDPADGNGTTCSKYMKIFSHYQLSI